MHFRESNNKENDEYQFRELFSRHQPGTWRPNSGLFFDDTIIIKVFCLRLFIPLTYPFVLFFAFLLPSFIPTLYHRTLDLLTLWRTQPPHKSNSIPTNSITSKPSHISWTWSSTHKLPLHTHLPLPHTWPGNYYPVFICKWRRFLMFSSTRLLYLNCTNYRLRTFLAMLLLHPDFPRVTKHIAILWQLSSSTCQWKLLPNYHL